MGNGREKKQSRKRWQREEITSRGNRDRGKSDGGKRRGVQLYTQLPVRLNKAMSHV